MKYIKTYEDKIESENLEVEDYSYWVIYSGERGIAALNKLNCKDYSVIKGDGEGKRYVYVCYNEENRQPKSWGWMPYCTESEEWFKDNLYTYKGSVNIPDYELRSIKYNL